MLIWSRTIKNKIIEQKKNKEITDSIHYAKRIQTALLPLSDKYLEKNIPTKRCIW